jgi:transcriptional regulator with XRE-family HTH domain
VRAGDIMKREWLNHLRVTKGLTQKQVASRSFIDRSYYSQIEIGTRNPSITVARNIATVLNFDPFIFFEDDHNNNNSSISKDTSLNLGIFEFFRNMESGHLLYLYSSTARYLHHAVTFSLIGIGKGSHCLFIVNQDDFIQIQQNLETRLTKDEIKNYIHHLNMEELKNNSPEDKVNHLKGLLSKFDNKVSIRIWSHEKRDLQNDWLIKLQSQLNTGDMKVNNNKILIIDSYNASIVSAGTHIKMMRNSPYLMTDYELFDSPLYQASTKSSIYPSLYIQEDM